MKKQQENKVKYLGIAIEKSTNPIFWINPDSNIINVNDKACLHLGYSSKDELINLKIDDISLRHHKNNFNDLWKEIKNRKTYTFETKHKTKDGDIIPVTIQANFIEFKGEEIVSCLVKDLKKEDLVDKKEIDSPKFNSPTLDVIAEPLYVVDKEFKIIKSNKATIKLFKSYEVSSKLSLKEIENRLFSELDDLKKVVELKKSIKIKKYFEFIDKWFDIGAYPIIDKNENLNFVVIYFYDISDNKKTEIALVESELRYRTAVEKSHDAIVIFWKNKVFYHNSKALDITGYSEEDARKVNIIDIIHPEDRAKIKDIWKRREEGKYVEKLTNFRILTKSGELKYIETNGDVVSYQGKKAVLISARDITNRVLLEKEKSLSHAAIDNVGEAIYLLNKDAYVCRSNDFCCGLWGISREELTKTKIFKINKKLNKKNWLAFWESMMLKKETVNEAIHTISGNKKVQVEVKYNLFEFDNIKYILAIASDITERKKSEQRITKQLLEIERLKDRLETENLYLKDEIKLNHNFNEIITKDNKLKKILQNVEKVASTDSSVLILGETGTGKELLARAIHDISKRRNKSLIKINCAALPANLLESELFGYEKGAFTGALSKRIGRFEIADKGTIFLDEIGELPMELQPKLLRVLQDGEFERLGSSKTIKVNVRIISASNRDLKKEISEKKFRPDLYYRLNVFPIYNPPLRDRKNDIPLLVNYFVNKFSKIHGKQIYRITQSKMKALISYSWPGNIRELENIIERSIIISRGNMLEFGDWLRDLSSTKSQNDNKTLEELERNYIFEILETVHWRVRGFNGAAEILGIKPTTLEAKMKKLGIARK